MTHIYVYGMIAHVCYDLLLCVPWLIPMRAMALACVCHNLFRCVLWLIPMSSMTHSYVFHDSFIRVTNTYTFIYIRLTPSIIYVALQVNRFQKIYLRIVQYKYLRSCSKHRILQNLILRTKFCGTRFVTQPSCVLDFHLTEICQAEMICIGGVPLLNRHLGGAGPSILYMIDRGGRVGIRRIKSYRTYAWVMENLGMSYGTHGNESWYT